jgi:hypothetical protein
MNSLDRIEGEKVEGIGSTVEYFCHSHMNNILLSAESFLGGLSLRRNLAEIQTAAAEEYTKTVR